MNCRWALEGDIGRLIHRFETGFLLILWLVLSLANFEGFVIGILWVERPCLLHIILQQVLLHL